ncbi:MAG: 2-oxoacid:acceptor oxidoreductase subunit alpha, partial [Planctomycetota bacterium]
MNDPTLQHPTPKVVELDAVTIRFAGDSGDGMQLTGTQFTNTAAILGNDINTLPDYPAEIRAPAGSLPGVSAFQLHFSSKDIRTPGDAPDVLVAMNPAALKVHLPELQEGGLLILNTDSFTEVNLRKAGYSTNPLEDPKLSHYRVFKIPLTTLTLNAIQEVGLSKRAGERCKNFFALGLLYYLYDRPMEHTLRWIEEKFGKDSDIGRANTLALKAGYNYADTTELFTTHYRIKKASLPPGKYRKITGNQATAYGLVAAAYMAERTLFYGSYPITPASDILHELAKLRHFGVKTFQAEDEIAAVCAAIGASFSGHLGVTGSSGPGIALKMEAIGLAVMTELPLIVINVQRGGPSTGLPTKTEQADLFQAILGRNGECPCVVLAAASPADCFQMALEATRIAFKYMVPVFLLSDGYIANGAEPWKIPALHELPSLKPKFHTDPETFQPYKRDPETLARPWAIPGT